MVDHERLMMNSYDSLHAPQAESGWKTWVDLTTRMRSDALSPADWEHFYPKYRSLIIMYGNKQKLSRDQIRELIDRVYDTLRAKDKISCYDPSRGRFRDYLGGIIRNCIRDLRKKARAEKRNFIVTMEELPEHSAEAPGEDEWLELWRNYLFSLALEELKRQVSPRHFQIFQLCKLQGRDASFVADFLQESTSNVYAVCSRCTKTLRKLVMQLQVELSPDEVSDETLLQHAYSSMKELRAMERETERC